MSYVFSKALTQHNEDRLKRQQPIILPNKIPPPVSCKAGARKVSLPPPVKRKPLTKSLSVDSFGTRSNSVDLTVVGGSEWKDFVLKRQKERDLEEAKQQQESNDSRPSSGSSNASYTTEGMGFDEVFAEPRRRTSSTSSFTREGVGEPIIEGRRLRRTSSSSTSGGYRRVPSIDLTQVGDDEWKRISQRKEKERFDEERRLEEEKSLRENGTTDQNDIEQTSLNTEAKDVSPRIVDGQWKMVVSPKDDDVTQTIHIQQFSEGKNDNLSQIVNGEWTKTKEGIATAKNSELSAVPEQTDMDCKDSSGTVPSVTLPRPRKISTELRRRSFSRSSSSSSSKSFSSGDGVPVIKRSLDLVNESKNAPRSERSMSFDRQTPYFCRLPRSLSIELDETLTLCELSLKTPRSVSSFDDILEKPAPVSPITSTSISEAEHSADVIAMKHEIAIERSKIELERRKLSETIDEIDNIEFDIDALIKPTNDDVFEYPSQSEGNYVTPVVPETNTTTVVEVAETFSSPVTTEIPAGLKPSDEPPHHQTPPNNSSGVESANSKLHLETDATGTIQISTESTTTLPAASEKPPGHQPSEETSPQFELPSSESAGPSIENIEKESVQVSTSPRASVDNTVENTEGSEILTVAWIEITEVPNMVSLDTTDDSVPKLENETVDMSVSDFTSMITASDEKVGVSKPALPSADAIKASSHKAEEENSPVAESTSDVQSRDIIPVEDEAATVTVPKETTAQPELNGIDLDTPCASIKDDQESVINQIESAINELVPSENSVTVVESSSINEIYACDEISEEKSNNISETAPHELVPSEEPISVEPLQNGVNTIPPNSDKSREQIIDTDAKKQPQLSPSEDVSNDKNLNELPPKTSEVNNGLLDNYVHIESNGVIS